MLLQGHVVESTDRFTHILAVISTRLSVPPPPQIPRRISLASNIFGRLANVCRKRTRLSLQTKIRLYNALVISVLLYGSEAWTVLKADERRLEVFHMNCQRRILGIRWFHFVTNASVTSQTGEEGLAILSEATLHFWSRATTTGSDTSPLRTTPGCGRSHRR